MPTEMEGGLEVRGNVEQQQKCTKTHKKAEKRDVSIDGKSKS